MFEVFTNTSQTLTTGTPIVFSTQKFSDSRIDLNTAGDTVVINTPGRYLILFDGIGGSNTADTVFTIQMYVNGVAQPCASTSNTVPTITGSASLGFNTIIQVNKSCCCVNNGQSIQFVATSTSSGSVSHANIVIIRL